VLFATIAWERTSGDLEKMSRVSVRLFNDFFCVGSE
jgi:hypothetical protein